MAEPVEAELPEKIQFETVRETPEVWIGDKPEQPEIVKPEIVADTPEVCKLNAGDKKGQVRDVANAPPVATIFMLDVIVIASLYAPGATLIVAVP
jgi:hypothetical protein